MEIKLTELELKALIRALKYFEAQHGDVLFDGASLNRARTKLEMALNGEKISAD